MSKKPASIDVQNEILRSALLAIAARHHGHCSPHDIVDAAADPRSPLHREFEWDDSEAAQMYRLAQAGALVRRVKLTIVREDPVTRKVKIKTTRALHSRPSQRNRAGGYETVGDILSDPPKRAELLETLLRELAAYRKRYADFSELAEVWFAIDEVTDGPSPKARGRGKGKSLGAPPA